MKNTKLQQKLSLQQVIVADPHLSNGAKAVAICLLFWFHNTKTGQCYPSNATVGAVVGMRPRTVIRHIVELVNHGYAFRDRRYNQTSITDFDWVKGSEDEVKSVRSRLKFNVSKLAGGSDKSDRGMCQNWHHDSVKTGTLTSELNQR